ncbi:hypothetical protein J3E69DRAFT_325707 [Trichoderma sp. SZMC 28015]
MRRFNISSNTFYSDAHISQGDMNWRQPARPAVCRVPYFRNKNLVGRPDLMNELNRLLPQESTGYRSAALWGRAGSGKTQLALEYAYRRFDSDKNCFVFWVDAQTQGTFLQDFESIGQKLDIFKTYLTTIDLLRAVRDQIEALPKWVLILDNADDLRLLGVNQEAEQIRNLIRYIPRASNGTVLWTSRDAHIAGTLVPPAQCIEVASMTSNEAKELLRKTRNLRKSTEEVQEVQEEEVETAALLEKLLWLPLAITQVGAYMRRTSTSAKEYLYLLEQGRKRWDTLDEYDEHRRLPLLKQAVTDVKQPPSCHFLVPIKRNPYFTGREDLLWALLMRMRPRLGDFDDCQKTIIEGPEGIGKTQVALEAAYRLHAKDPSCSIFWVSAKDTISLENSYYNIGKKLNIEGLDNDGANINLLVRIALDKEISGPWLLVVDDADDFEWLRFTDYLPSGLHGSILFIQRKLKTTARPYIPKDSILRVEEMDCGEALNLLKICLKEAQETEFSDIKQLLDFLDDLSRSYERQGHWAEAQKLGKELIEAHMVIFGDEDNVTLAIMDEMLQRYKNRGQWQDAEILQLRIIETHKKILGADKRTVASIRSLAFIYKNQGRLEEADKLYGSTIGIHEMKFGNISENMSLTSESEDLEGDSGYASASRRATTTVPSVSGLQNDIDDVASPEKAEVENVISVSVDDDVRSVISEGDDVRSQISDVTTNEGMTGKALIRAFLAEQPQFKALCEKALAKMNRHRFIENMSRLLRSFHKGLAEEAKSEAEKVVTGLLRSKRGRRRISEQLAAHIDMEHEETQDKIDLEISSSKMQSVEDWLSQAMKPSSIEDVELSVDLHQDIEQDSDAMEMDSEDGNEAYSFPYISELKAFLLASKAFQSLQVQFALMFLSSDLGDVLQSIPRESIWLSQEQDVSISNRLKILVENTTKVRWNWWPLGQGKRMLNLGESRLFWRCTCGVEQWEEISPEQREFVERILEWSDNCPPLASRCAVRKVQVTLFSSIKGILQYAGGQITRPSRAATRYTPQESNPSTPPENQRQPLTGATPLQQQQGPTIGQQVQATIPDPNDSLQWWILFGVRGARRTLVPTQIHVTSQTTDSYIFQELKRCYTIYRGRLRLWLSVWRLDYCEVVKFSRLTPDRMVREYRELPSDKDYHYDPRAGERDVRNPPISPHHFQTLFYACPSPCTWPFPHDCIPLIANTANLARIPKRTREFEKDQSSPIWGFETVFAVSFSYVLAYHVVMVAGPLIFWGLWMKFHPDDLQNASVPITVVIGALSLFWSGAGILTSRERE